MFPHISTSIFEKLAVFGVAWSKLRLGCSGSLPCFVWPYGHRLWACQPPKTCTQFQLGPLGLAIRLFWHLSAKTQPKRQSALWASRFEHHKCPSPQLFACAVSASLSWTCRAWLRPCGVLKCDSISFSFLTYHCFGTYVHRLVSFTCRWDLQHILFQKYVFQITAF